MRDRGYRYKNLGNVSLIPQNGLSLGIPVLIFV